MSFRDRAERLAAVNLLRGTVGAFSNRMWRPKLVGPEPFPEGPCFLYGNHSNMLDPFVLNAFTPWAHPTAGVMTLERLRGGLAAWALRGIGLLPTRKRIPEPPLIRAIYRLLDEGRQVVIYPEGGQRWDGRPMPWIEATAKLFVKARVPVYPVVTHGSYLGWPRWATYPRPARLQVEVKPPLALDRRTPLADALATLQSPIAAPDDKGYPDATRPRRAFRPAAGIERLLYRDPATGRYDAVTSPDGTRVMIGARAFTMRPDSTLFDEQTGETLFTGDLYAQIKSLPLEADAGGAYLRHRVAVHVEAPPGQLLPRGEAEATLLPDAVRLADLGLTRPPETLPLETLLYADIERNYKLQLTFPGQMIQLSFVHGGSALAWADALDRLRRPSVRRPS